MTPSTQEKITDRHGDNLYPATFTETFGSYELKLDVPAGVWNPTPHGVHLGNMLTKIRFDSEHVLELGTGCGIHAILLAMQGASSLTVTEIDQEPLDNARHNINKHNVNIPVDYITADWTNVDGGLFDVMVSNPPFAQSGKRYRRYFLDTFILDAHKLVKPSGRLIFVQSSMADIPRSIKLMKEHGMNVEVIGETSGPFRDYYFEDASFMREIEEIPGAYEMRDGTYYEKLIVFEATLPE